MTLPGGASRTDDDTRTADPVIAATFDRAADERIIEDLLPTLRADAGTRVLVLSETRAPLSADRRTLHLVPVADVSATELVFLGRWQGAALLLAIAEQDEADRIDPPGGWAQLRSVGGDLDPVAADVLTSAVSMARWLEGFRFCPACGQALTLRHAGWSRSCPQCGREHFPRTDPAVIVAISDESGRRLLLGSNAAWPAGRFSCFAGFVEAGESAESALHREVHEEAGVRLSSVEALGSQAWPYPQSLMLGYLAVATDVRAARADGEEINEVRWFDLDEIGAALAGESEVTLPGTASIAHRLIRTWYDRGMRAEEADA